MYREFRAEIIGTWKAEWDCLFQGGSAVDGLANSLESVTPLFLGVLVF